MPFEICTQAPEFASQILTVLSYEHEASRWPSGENTTDVTQLLWPFKICRQVPEFASHILTVLSFEHETSRWPSGEKATEVTGPLWPSRVYRHAPQFASTFGFSGIHDSSSLLNISYILLRSGLKISADAYTWSGISSITHLFWIVNRLASCTKSNRSLSGIFSYFS